MHGKLLAPLRRLALLAALVVSIGVVGGLTVAVAQTYGLSPDGADIAQACSGKPCDKNPPPPPPGPPGPPGEQGPPGPAGPQGPAGPPGAPGAAGANGATGAKGEQGVPGQNGQNGQDGQDGAKGARGPRGPMGKMPLVNKVRCPSPKYFNEGIRATGSNGSVTICFEKPVVPREAPPTSR